MNFRLTRGKIIVSIIILGVIWSVTFIIKAGLLNVNLPAFIINFLNMHDLINIFSLSNIFLFVIEIVVVYLILSIFQKKKKGLIRKAQSIPSQQSSPSLPLASPQI